MSFKLAIAIASVVMTIAGYLFYFKDIFAGKTKPHMYTWLIWGLLTGIAFFGQLADGAGTGAWVTGVTAAVSFLIVALSFKYGEKNITRSDTYFLIASLASIVLWLVTNDPLLSIILITIVDFVAFVPTIRKSLIKPGEETLIHYFFAGGKFVLAIIALENYSIVTTLYPLSLVLANWLFVVLVLIRRDQLSKENHEDSTRKKR